MTNLFCVRADSGMYTEHFVRGGFAGIGWFYEDDLTSFKTREALYPLFEQKFPELASPIVKGNHIGQIGRFLFDIKAGDCIITPAADSEWLRYGFVEPEPSYFFFSGNDGCKYRQRRRVQWSETALRRSDFSVPFQNTMRALLTVFSVSQKDEFFEAIGRSDLVIKRQPTAYDPVKVVLDQVLLLDDKEFELLVGHLLTALGFEGSEVTGRRGDGGVDATGVLNVANLAKVKVFVQVKRYKLGTRISANTVKELRTAIPFGGQGAFVTTADFQKSANDVALADGFPRIGLINGSQLVDLLIEHWDDIPIEFQDRLGLRPGLVLR
jgi:restriction system protein